MVEFQASSASMSTVFCPDIIRGRRNRVSEISPIRKRHCSGSKRSRPGKHRGYRVRVGNKPRKVGGSKFVIGVANSHGFWCRPAVDPEFGIVGFSNPAEGPMVVNDLLAVEPAAVIPVDWIDDEFLRKLVV